MIEIDKLKDFFIYMKSKRDTDWLSAQVFKEINWAQKIKFKIRFV
jgi:hypothetical protein